MALSKQHVQILSEKLDTSRDDKTAPMGQVIEAQNCFRLKAGEYRRRFGRAALATATIPTAYGSLANVWQLAAFKNSLISISKHSSGARSIWQYSSAASKWLAPGQGANNEGYAIRTQQKGPVSSTRRSIHASEAQPGSPDVAFIPGTAYAVCVFQETVASLFSPGTAFLTVIYDMTTGAAVVRQYTFGSNAHVEAGVSKVVISYINSAQTAVSFSEWTAAAVLTQTAAAGTDFTVTSPAVAASRRLDTYNDGTYIYVAVLTSTATTTHLAKYDPSTSAVIADAALATDSAAGETRTFGWLKNNSGNGKVLLGAGSSTDGLRVFVMSATFAVSDTHVMDTAADTKAGGINVTGYVLDSTASGNFVVVWDLPTTIGGTFFHGDYTKVNARISTAIQTATVWLRSVSLRSKVFVNAFGEWYVLMTYGSQTQPSYFLMRLPQDVLTAVATNPRCRAPITKVNMWRGNGRTELKAGLTNVVSSSGTDVCAVTRQSLSITPASGVTSAATITPTVKFGVDLVLFTPDQTTTGRPVEFGESLMVPMGTLQQFDGTQMAELGFHCYPEPIKATAAAGSSDLVAGTYQYCHVFRYIDAQGRVHRSAPSVPVSITVTLAQAVTLSTGTASSSNILPTCRIIGRDATDPGTSDQLVIEIYRTKADATTFYLLYEIANDPTADTTAEFIDGTTVDKTDALLGLATLLYAQPSTTTSPGILPNHAPPQFRAIWASRDRLWGIDADNPDTVWFSKPIAAGEGVAFSSALSLRCEDDQGEFYAGAAMDDKTILYKARATYVAMGDGPDNLGRGSYPAPNRLPGGVGTVNARSVITTPNGTWSHSTKGIHCVGRGVAMEDAGKPVQDWLTSATVVDVVHEPARSWIRFFLSTGNCLVFDYYFNEWYKFTNQTTIAAVLAGSTIYQASGAATVSADSTTLYTDDASAAYSMKVVLAWIATAGIKGFQRVWETQQLGTYVGAHDVCVDLSYDYVDTVIETCSRAGADPWEFAIKPMRQKCSAIKMAIYDGTRATGTITCVAKTSLVNGQTVTVGDGVNTATAFTWDLLGTGTDTAYVKYVNVSSTALTSSTHMASALADAMAAQKQTGVFRVSASPAAAVVSLVSDAAGTAGNVTITETVADAGFTVSGMSGGAHISTAGFRLSAWAMSVGVKAALDKMASSRKTAA